MFDFTSFVTEYGYWAVFIGSLIEGEMIVSIAGTFAYQGLLSLPYVIFFSTIATIIGEQICFYIGRFLGQRYLHKFPKFHSKIEIGFKLLHKYQTSFILMCRFLYGLRILSPFIIGSAKIDPLKYTILNCIAAVIWSVISTSIGYFGAYLGNHFGYSTAGQYIFTGVFILCTLSILPFFIKQIMKEMKNLDI